MPSSTDLPTAGAGKQSHALAAAHRQQRVDGAHAGVERLAHRVALHGVERAARHRLRAHHLQGPQLVHRHALRVDHPAEQAGADRQMARAVFAAPPRVRRLAQFGRLHHQVKRHDPRTTDQAVHLAGGHQKSPVTGEPDHLAKTDWTSRSRLSGTGEAPTNPACLNVSRRSSAPTAIFACPPGRSATGPSSFMAPRLMRCSLSTEVAELRMASTTAGDVPVPNGSRAVAVVVPAAAAPRAAVLTDGMKATFSAQSNVP